MNCQTSNCCFKLFRIVLHNLADITVDNESSFTERSETNCVLAGGSVLESWFLVGVYKISFFNSILGILGFVL